MSSTSLSTGPPNKNGKHTATNKAATEGAADRSTHLHNQPGASGRCQYPPETQQILLPNPACPGVKIENNDGKTKNQLFRTGSHNQPFNRVVINLFVSWYLPVWLCVATGRHAFKRNIILRASKRGPWSGYPSPVRMGLIAGGANLVAQ